MIEWKKGKPKTCIDCCLVIYMGDYEFARFNGEKWELCFGDNGGCYWVTAQEPIKFYARLNRPTE